MPKVYIVGRTSDKLERVVEVHGRDVAGQIIPLTADITSKKEIEKLVEEVSSKEKCLHVLVNNAGISLNKLSPGGSNAKEMAKNLFENENETFDMWCDTYRTNVPQLYFMTTAFLPLLEAATEQTPGFSGTVINITSISGLVKISQGHYSYNASKGAAIHLTKMLASEIASNGIKIRVNNIAPGVYPSEMTAGDSNEDQKSELSKEKYEKIIAARPGKDEDMAGAVLFAVCNQYLNGQTVAVDGGYMLMAGTLST